MSMDWILHTYGKQKLTNYKFRNSHRNYEHHIVAQTTSLRTLTLTVPVTTIDALQHFETG